MIPIPADADLAPDLLATALASADIVDQLRLPPGAGGAALALRETLVVDASSSLADDDLGLPSGGQLAAASGSSR